MLLAVRRYVTPALFTPALAIIAAAMTSCAPKFNFAPAQSLSSDKSTCTPTAATTDWNYLGQPGAFSNASVSSNTTLAMSLNSTGVPYVLFADQANSNAATVMYWTGTTWARLGTPDFSAGGIAYPAIAIDSTGNPYVAYEDQANSSALTVMHWNGSSWVTIGSPGFSAGNAYFIALALDNNGYPYVSYEDMANSGALTVMHWNGSSWGTVGSAGFTAPTGVNTTSIALDSSQNPYVTFLNSSSSKVTVVHWNGSAWSYVGSSSGISSGTSYSPSIALDSSQNPYVAYVDEANNYEPTVLHWNGSAWSTVGGGAVSTDAASNTVLTFDKQSNEPLVVYQDGVFSYKSVAMEWNGSSWVSVGPATGFADDPSAPLSLSSDGNGHFYLSLSGSSTGYSVMAYRPDNAATGLGWTESYPASGSPVMASWSPSLACPTAQEIQYYADEVCVTPQGSPISLLSTDNQDSESMSTGVHTSYRIIDTLNTGESVWSQCSSEMATQPAWTDLGGTPWVEPFSQAMSTVFSFSGSAMALDSSGNAYVFSPSDLSALSTVKKWNGSSWANMGFFNMQNWAGISSAIGVDGSQDPYVAAVGIAHVLQVDHWNGSSWANLGTTSSVAWNVPISMSVDSSGNAYVAYANYSGNTGSAKYWNGSSWTSLGAFTSTNKTFSFDIAAVSSTDVYVAYEDQSHSNKLTVVNWNGTSWSTVGSADFSPGGVEPVSIALDGGTPSYPYVAYIDSSYKITVQHWNGSSWSIVGSAGFATADLLNLAVDSSGNPYVFFDDQSSSTGQATLMKWNGSSWVDVGPPDFSAGSIAASWTTSLAIHGSTPYVMYNENGQVKVRTY